jgi:hypothetical protein
MSIRKKLKRIDGIREKFQGTFVRYGEKPSYRGYPKKTLLLKDIMKGSEIVTDHQWFNMTKGFEALGDLQEGDRIEFHARVKPYYKGYKGYREEVRLEKPIELDYKLSHPTKIKIIQ